MRGAVAAFVVLVALCGVVACAHVPVVEVEAVEVSAGAAVGGEEVVGEVGDVPVGEIEGGVGEQLVNEAPSDTVGDGGGAVAGSASKDVTGATSKVVDDEAATERERDSEVVAASEREEDNKVVAASEREEDIEVVAATEGEEDNEVVAQLTAELVEVDKLIALSQRKAELLRQLRTAALSGARIHVDATARAAWESSTTERVPAHDTSVTTPAPQRVSPRGGHAPNFASSFMQKASVTLQDTTVVAVEVVIARARRPRGASRRSPIGAVFLVVVATSDGNFRFYDKTGEELLVVPNGHDAPLTAVSADFTDIPAIFSAATDGSVRVATVNVWYDGKLIAGRLPANARHGHAPLPEMSSIHNDVIRARRADEGREALHVDPDFEPLTTGMSLHMSLFAKWNAKDDAAAALELLDDHDRSSVPDSVKQGLGVHVSCVQAYTVSRRRMVVTATNTGVLSVHLVNGTLVNAFHYTMGDRVLPRGAKPPAHRNMPPPDFGQPITAITRYGAEVAFAVDRSIHFVNLLKPSRLHTSTRMCDGTGAPVVSLAFDFVKPAHLWAGTSAGDMLMFNTRAKVQQATHCRLVHKVAGDGGPVSVQALRGYVVALSAPTLQVHNVTDGDSLGMRWLLDHDVSDMVAEGSDASTSSAALSASSVGSRMSPNHQTMVAIAVVGGNTIQLYESLLPYHPHHYDIGWIRAPLLAVAVAVVIGWQVLKRRGKPAGPSVEDIANTLRVPQATGGRYGSMGDRFRRR